MCSLPPGFCSQVLLPARPSPPLSWSCITKRKISPPTSSPNSTSSLPLSISANFLPACSLWSPRPASHLNAPPFSRTSPISFSALTRAIIPENYSAVENEPHALLRFRSKSILSFLTEDSDAHQCGREVVHRWNRRGNNSRYFFLRFFMYFVERAAARPEGRPAFPT